MIFVDIKCCKTYLGPMLPPGNRNRQLIYPNYFSFPKQKRHLHQVKQEVNCTVILPPLVFPAFTYLSFEKCAKYCQILPNIAKFCQILPNVAKCCQMLPNVAKCCQMLPNVAKCCQMLPNFAKFCQILPNFAKFCQIIWIINSYGIKKHWDLWCHLETHVSKVS